MAAITLRITTIETRAEGHFLKHDLVGNDSGFNF